MTKKKEEMDNMIDDCEQFTGNVLKGMRKDLDKINGTSHWKLYKKTRVFVLNQLYNRAKAHSFKIGTGSKKVSVVTIGELKEIIKRIEVED